MEDTSSFAAITLYYNRETTVNVLLKLRERRETLTDLGKDG